MHIADVERDTGIGKDTLRIWERRYNFPRPARDVSGERIYPFTQVERLRIIRRLLDKGMRPGKVIGLDLLELHQLLDVRAEHDLDSDRYAYCNSLLKLIRMYRGHEVRESLNRILVKEGLHNFIVNTIVPMNAIVGNAWLRGDLTVAEEHLYTEQVQNVIRYAIQMQAVGTQSPRLLLTTFPTEEHGLGLLMVEAVCTGEGAQCVSLGPRLPLTDMVAYATDGQFDVVAVSFSAAYQSREIVRDLTRFRDMLPDHIAIWAGGAGIRHRRIDLPNVFVQPDIKSVPKLVAEWRKAHIAS